jgi:hypothetical protein
MDVIDVTLKLETDCHYRRFSDFPSVFPRECCNLTFVSSPLSLPFHILSLIFIWTFSIMTTHMHHTDIWKLPVSETLCGFVCCDNEKFLMNISYNTYVKPLSGIYMTLHFTSLVFLTFHCTICIS